MKETGIIMSGDHPRLILDGTKTMTRRTWGLEEINKDPDSWILLGRYVDSYNDSWRFRRHGIDEEIIIKCPYGGVGDRLWVKETFCKVCYDKDTIQDICYKEDLGQWTTEGGDTCNLLKWTPSIFMPRWASRITLEITGLRAERLQEVTEEDAKAEGVSIDTLYGERHDSYRQAFSFLWNDINAKRGYGWETNHWVWPIKFHPM